MPFPFDDRQILLAVKGVGPTVIQRLEGMGFQSLRQLADADANDILAQGAALTGSSCWKNSPQAKAAIQGAITAAVAHISR
jgi:predicted RecB family nuclease